MARYLLPRNYKILNVLGRGGFGVVVTCLKRDTNETVAVKIPQNGSSVQNELTLLKIFKRNDLDKSNIVRFIDSFTMRDKRIALAFEKLDMTLWNYMFYHKDNNPLELHEVRSVVQQMATALNALKTVKVIHSDIKLDNIMLVDHDAQPLTVKLIDFGLAFKTSKVKQGDIHQVTQFRAPEIILGLPFSEAIDMWSLGIVMAFMVLNELLFPGKSEYDVMRCIVELLGVPPAHLLNAGMNSTVYFVKRPSGEWRLKTPQEFWEKSTPAGDYRAYFFRNLDDLETLPQNNLLMVEAEEIKECIDLLKAMLRMDASERITPSQVLTHPFITRGTLQHSSDDETSESRTSRTSEPEANEPEGTGTVQADETKHSKAADIIICETSGTSSTSPPSVQPPQTESSWSGEYDTCSSDSIESLGLPPSVIRVRPAPPKCCFRWYDDGGLEDGGLDDGGLEDGGLEDSGLGDGGLDDGGLEDGGLEDSGLGDGRLDDGGLDDGRLDDISENSLVENPRGAESDPPLILPEACNMEQGNEELTLSDSDDMEPERKKRKKKKNCFKRFILWTKRKFCSCISADQEED